MSETDQKSTWQRISHALRVGDFNKPHNLNPLGFTVKILTPLVLFCTFLLNLPKQKQQMPNYSFLDYTVIKGFDGKAAAIEVLGIGGIERMNVDSNGMVIEAANKCSYIDVIGQYPVNERAAKKYDSLMNEVTKEPSSLTTSYIRSKPESRIMGDAITIETATIAQRDKNLQKALLDFAKSQVPDSITRGRPGRFID